MNRTKHVWCEFKCKFYGRKCKWNQAGITINVGANVKFKTKYRVCKKYYILNPATRTYENGKYLANIIKDSVIQKTNNFLWNCRFFKNCRQNTLASAGTFT